MFEKKPGKIFAIARVPRKSNVVEIRPSPLSGEFGRDGPEVGARNPSHVRIGTSDDAECLRPYAESVTLRRMVKLNSRKRARRKSSSRAVDARPSELGALLADLRTAKGLSLRQVEEATDRAVSNAYLSQLENGKIQKPSPNVLHSLAEIYAVPYEGLMEKAGYLLPSKSAGSARRARLAVFSIDDLTAEEEEELLKYLAFLRSRRTA